MFGTFGFTELILILVIVLIIFGAGKLPQLGEGLGKAIKGFKKSVHEAEAIEAEAEAQAQAQVQAQTATPVQPEQAPPRAEAQPVAGQAQKAEQPPAAIPPASNA